MEKSLPKLKRSTVIHVIVWAIVFALPYIFTSPEHDADPHRNAYRAFATSTTLVWMGLFYLNAGILIPRLFYRRKYIAYVLLLILFYAVAMIFFSLFFKLWLTFKPFDLWDGIKWNILPFIFTIAVSATYKTMNDRVQSDAIAEERQKENLKTELSFLRSQISPHFLFNVLNNIVALVRLKSDDLEPTVLKLSSLMQYMLYETDEEKVLLADEAKYLQSYIDLQQQRFGSKVKINTALNVEDNHHTIEPMLLIPFVENAFKHGIGLITKPEITIELSEKENWLHLLVQNKYNEANIAKDKTSGIGLANVQRRLELLYGEDYFLDINKTDERFTVSLKIKLK